MAKSKCKASLLSPMVLTIAGSDPSGGAGLQQDLRVFSVLGGFGAAVPTALTVQNTLGVFDVMPVPVESIDMQLQKILEDIPILAAKTGMLVNEEIVRKCAEHLNAFKPEFLVVDPIMYSSNGHVLLDTPGWEAMKEFLMPIADVITPNMEEAEAMWGRPVKDLDDMRAAVIEIQERWKKAAIVVKGGHLGGDTVVDVLCLPGGEIHEITRKRVKNPNTHGTGCAYSAALTLFLANGLNIVDACKAAAHFMTLSIKGGFKIGEGTGPVNPLAFLRNEYERADVLAELDSAWELLSSYPCRSLVPEVQINIGYSLPYALDIDDVAAFPGRIVAYGKGVAKVGCPSFGASSHIARIILTAMEYDAALRSAMNIRYDESFLNRAKELGYSVAEFSRADEPSDLKEKEGSTLIWGIRQAFKEHQGTPDVIFDTGEVGKEPIIRVLGCNPVEVVEKALVIGGLK